VSLEKMLDERSGLLGLSGISSDKRVLQESASAISRTDGFVRVFPEHK
jgi:acetate kinase